MTACFPKFCSMSFCGCEKSSKFGRTWNGQVETALGFIRVTMTESAGMRNSERFLGTWQGSW